MTLYIAVILDDLSDISSMSFSKKKKWIFKSEKNLLMFISYYFPLLKQKIWKLFNPTLSIAMLRTHNILQEPSRADLWQTIPNPGKLFGVTGVAISDLLKLTCTCKNNNYRGDGCVSLSQYLQRNPDLDITDLEGMLKF